MTNKQSPPGHEETTLKGLEEQMIEGWRREGRVLEQRCCPLEFKIDTNRRCTTGAGLIAIIAFLLTLGHIAYDLWRALNNA